MFLLPQGPFEASHRAQLNPVVAGGERFLRPLGGKGYTRRPFTTRRWVRRHFISTSRTRGISIRAAEGPLTALSAEVKARFGHGNVAR